MIDYRELRAGNLVETPRGIYPVGIISYSVIHVQNTKAHPTMLPWMNSKGFDLYPNEHINPIPINADWLERFGFLNNSTKNNEWYLHLMPISDSAYDSISLYWFDGIMEIGTFNEQGKLGHIKYIHQLQNAFFALTGTELAVKELT